MRSTPPFPLRPTLILALLACLGGCASSGSLVSSVYRRGEIAYRIGSLPAAWRPSSPHGADLAYRRSGGGIIAVSSSCNRTEDVPLDVLTNHLLFGVEAQVEHGRTAFTLDGRAALRTQLSGELDGVRVELELVVLKKDGCTYDLQLIAAPAIVAQCQPDFAAFVQGFATLTGPGPGN